jgi:5-methyltetrahydropteroyltriglutamate--homocysteine methyltransferase
MAALVTTVVGSYPQPEWLIDRERLGSRLPPRVRARELWRIAGATSRRPRTTRPDCGLRHGAGRDRRRHGREMRRESYSNRFATALDGVDLDTPGVALDRTGHPNPVPRVSARSAHPAGRGAGRRVPAARSRTGGSRSRCPGPFTMTQQAQNDHYATPNIGARLRRGGERGAPRPQGGGADVVQIDEPYLAGAPRAAREYAIEAINRALEGSTATRSCTRASVRAYRPRAGIRVSVPARAPGLRRHAPVARGRAAGPRPRGAPRRPGQGHRARRPRPR